MTEGPLYKYRYQPVAEVIGAPRQQAAPPSSQNIAPARIADSDVGFAPTTTRVVQPPYAAASHFYRRRRIPHSEVIMTFTIPNAGIVTPQKLVDTDTFSAPTLSTSSVILGQNSFNDADVFFAPKTTSTALPARFVDSDTIFVPIVGGGFTTTLFVDADAFFSPLIGPRPNLLVDNDALFAPSFIGGVSIGPARITDNDVFFAPTLATLKQTAPTFFIDSDVIYVPGLAATKQLTPTLLVDTDAFSGVSVVYNLGTLFFADSDSFRAPTLTGGTVSLLPGLISDQDTFFTPGLINFGADIEPITAYAAASAWMNIRRFIPPMSVTVVIARPIAGDIRPNEFIDIDTIFTPGFGGGQFMVHPGIYVEGDTHYIPTVSGGILKRNYNEVDSSTIVKNPRWLPPPMSITVVIRGPAQGTLVTPSLFADSDVFFTPALGVGAANITPTLFIDPDSPRMALVTGGGAQPTTAGRINDADSFPVPGISVGGVTIRPALFIDEDLDGVADGDHLFAPTTGLFVGPTKFTDTDTVFSPAIAAISDIKPPVFVDSDVFFAPVLSIGPVNLTPFRFIDADILMMPSVGSKIDVGFFTDTSTFYSPTVAQRNDITPSLIADTDRVFRPQLIYNQTIAASSIIDVDTLFEPFFPSDPKYTYPVGHGMESDYSIRRPRQGRVIIGRH